ncbi:hypothetical protein EYF80_014953 [Liparis tanakae]|uniref:Uncharacterized protein n=1 Tax=Liparis tanakae TaxID=230148 RepID=A0A4Z2ICP1_9TELE|nr:hypothetical protein EYF80_014953 [Liparis tanakae]
MPFPKMVPNWSPTPANKNPNRGIPSRAYTAPDFIPIHLLPPGKRYRIKSFEHRTVHSVATADIERRAVITTSCRKEHILNINRFLPPTFTKSSSSEEFTQACMAKNSSFCARIASFWELS